MFNRATTWHSALAATCWAILMLHGIASHAEASRRYSQVLRQTTEIINPSEDSSALIEVRQAGPEIPAGAAQYTGWFHGQGKLLLRKTAPAADYGQTILIAGLELGIQLPTARRPLALSSVQRWESDVSFADMARANFGRDYSVAQVQREGTKESLLHFELQSAGPDAVFPSIELWIRKADAMPVKAIFALSGERSRVCEYGSIRPVMGVLRPTSFTFTAPGKDGWRAEMRFTHWARQPLEEKWFTLSALGKMEAFVAAPQAPPPTATLSHDGHGAGADMVHVPAGAFVMGRDNGFPDERPAHTLTASAFWIDRHEVTVADFLRFVAQQKMSLRFAITSPSMPKDYFTNPAFRAFPMVNVDWFLAKAYCAYVGKRLPREAEWEKAARGSDGRLYPWGNFWDEERANSRESPFSSLAHGKAHFTSAVGQYAKGANQLGLQDMAGNVAEWVQDWYEPYPGNDTPSEDYGRQYKVIRGGSWISPALSLTTVARDYASPRFGYESIGFRCARDDTSTSRQPALSQASGKHL